MSDNINALLATPTVKETNWNEVIGAQNALIANQNALRDQQAQKAMADIYRRAYNPLTGTYDQGKINAGIAQSPAALGNAKQVIEGGAHAVGAGATTQSQQLENAAKLSGQVATEAIGLIKNPTPEGVDQAFKNLEAMRTASGLDNTAIEAERLRVRALPRDQILQYGYTKNLQHVDALRQMIPQTQGINTGGMTGVPLSTQQWTPWGQGGTSVGAGGAPLTLSPGEATTRQTVTAPGGVQTEAPAGFFAPPGAVAPHLRPQLQPAGPQNPLGTGRHPEAQGGTGTGTNAPATGDTATPGAGGAPVVRDPLQLAGQETDFKQYRADLGNVGQRYQNINTLSQARDALEQARTGAGLTKFQTLMSIITSISPTVAAQIGAAKQDEQYTLASKYLSDYARNSGAATHSDAQLSAAKASNPTVDINNLAARDVVAYQTGRERQAIAATLMAPDKTGRGYGKHGGDFIGKTDPRGFGWDAYSDDQKRAIAESVLKDPAAQNKLAYSISLARKLAEGKLGGE